MGICDIPTVKYPSGRRGTDAGYQAHRKTGESPCNECEAAHVLKGRDRWMELAPEARELRRHQNRIETERFRRESPDKYRANKYKLIANRKALINAAKDVPCADCGIKYPPYVMQFDHLHDKEFQIGNSFQYALERVVTEIAKCEVVCANCHSERTHQRWMEGRQHDEAV